MASGWDLSSGIYDDRNVTEDELFSAILTVFSQKSKKTNTYKFALIKALLDNLYNADANLVISFDDLFLKFAAVYWTLVTKHHLHQQPVSDFYKGSNIEQLLNKFKDDNSIPDDTPYQSLGDELLGKLVKIVKRDCSKYVIGALYLDTNKLLYSFDKKAGFIKLNPRMYMFLCKRKTVIEKLNYYHFAKFLEKIETNSNHSDGLLTKIDESAKRSNLSFFFKILYEEFEENTCFYCGRKLNLDKKDKNGVIAIDVDHFIPWSFIKDDRLWNMVLSCPRCNRSKSDKLASTFFLDLLKKRNISLCERAEDQMKNYDEDKLSHIYEYAIENGYSEIWNHKQTSFAGT